MIEFLEEPHLYLVDGILTPSVSEILHFIFPDKYKGVNKKILNRKAQYGTTIHESVEMFENNLKTMNLEEAFNTTIQAKGLNYIQEASLRQYVKLKIKNKIFVIEQERMIQYLGKYAGRFDMIAEINGCLCLCDIKTTAELDEEYLSWQLSYYELATGKTFDKLYAIWLPKKNIGVLKEIKRKPKELLLKKLNEFLKSKGEIELWNY